MKHMKKIIIAVLITSGVAGTAYQVQANDVKINDALAVTSASVSLNHAVDLALQKVPGTPVAVQFEDNHGKAVWNVEILAYDQTVHVLDIDAASGDLMKNRLDKPDRKNEENDD